MNETKKEYVISTDEEYYSCDVINSIGDVIEYARSELVLSDDDCFHIGTPERMILHTEAHEFLEILMCGYEDFTGDWSEAWEKELFNKKSKLSEKIQVKLDEICELIHDDHPVNFFAVRDAKETSIRELRVDVWKLDQLQKMN